MAKAVEDLQLMPEFVAAELAAMFQDKQGGVFRWVGEAFGKRTGFVAIWLHLRCLRGYLI